MSEGAGNGTSSGTELGDAFRRIFVQHWLIIALAVALGLGVGLTRAFQGTSYTATTRLVLDTPDPRSSAESVAIADTVRAIATSQAQIRAALAAGKVAGRDPIQIARHRVSVAALGTSGVIAVSVTDPSAKLAAGIANALAREIINTRSSISTGRFQTIRADLDRQIAALDRRITRADAATRALLLQQRSALESDRANILATEAARPKPSIITAARVPDHADSTPLVAYLVLGGILGLVLGVGVAAGLETVRPSFVGGASLAREFGTRFIGATGSGDLRWRVELAASSAGLRNLGLISVSKAIATVDVESIARQLDIAAISNRAGAVEEPEVVAVEQASVAAEAGVHVSGRGKLSRVGVQGRKLAPAPGARATRVRSKPLEMIRGEADGDVGLLLVTSETLRRSEVVEAKTFLDLLHYPVLGLIVHERSRRSRKVEGMPQ